jgi:hypothetical protein
MVSRHFITAAVVAVAASTTLTLSGAGAAQASAAPAWHTAIAAPGLAALNTGNNAGGETMACPSAGNCTADGIYYDKSGHEQAFVIGETNGVWGKAIEAGLRSKYFRSSGWGMRSEWRVSAGPLGLLA